MTQARCLHPFARSDILEPSVLPRTSKSRFNPRELNDPLTVLPGVGPATAREAAKIGLHTIGDLLFHFPHRHEDFTTSRVIGELKWGEEATVRCVLKKISLRRTRRRNLRLVVATVADETGYMEAIWFNQDYLAEQLSPGDEMLLRGRYEGGGRQAFRVIGHEVLGHVPEEEGGEGAGPEAAAPEAGQPQIAKAEPGKAGPGQAGPGLHTSGLVPVYHTTEKITVKRIRGWLGREIHLAARLADPLPATLRAAMMLPLRGDAVITMHFPESQDEFRLARQRLIFDELFLMQVGLLAHRRMFEKERKGLKLGRPGKLISSFLRGLPFKLTDDQSRVCAEISGDLGRAVPMQRLLQGDVGAGKTVVAVYTMLRAVEDGRQAALMAPTEVLAEQHFLNLQRMLAGTDVRLAFLSSRLKAAEREELLNGIAAGGFDLVVGTHALIQEDVAFHSLAVVVVDEQHRFGVEQREELAEKATRGGITPHVLHMTATPIPRTLALTLYGDLEVSTIHSLPAGRRKVKTWQVPETKRAGAYRFIREQLDAGRQCFVVCPLIEESEALEARAVETEAGHLAAGEFKGYRLGVLHGQMPVAQRQETMSRFVAGAIQVLVTTTVIEVGVDVPNASVMMVEEADRFGLAQLHQLRGRVGRGVHESYCLLFGDPKTEQAIKRIEAMTKTTDGFRLADMDLEIRGEGQLFGTRQSGLPDLKLARLIRDQDVLQLARRKAAEVIRKDAELKRPGNALLKEEIERVFGEAVEWLRRV